MNDIRAEFEKWYLKEHGCDISEFFSDGGYDLYKAELLWIGFQAGAALNAVSVGDDRELIEQVAMAIYDQWKYSPEYRPWVMYGNSLVQDKTRRIARDAIEAAKSSAIKAKGESK